MAEPMLVYIYLGFSLLLVKNWGDPLAILSLFGKSPGLMDNYKIYFNGAYIVKPLNSGHLRVLTKVSAIRSCPLYRGFK